MACRKMDVNELQEIRREWPELPPEVVPEDKRTDYIRRRKAVDMYIEGRKISDIESATGEHCSNIIRLVRKCISKDKDGCYYGYSALLPYSRTVLRDERYSGKFHRFISEYGLEDFIAGNWFGDKKYTTEKMMTVRSLHKKFIDKCIEIGVPDYGYPFDTVDQGYVSLTKYVNELEKKNIKQAALRENRDNRQKLMTTGFGKRRTKEPVFPYSVVQIDGHSLDLIYNVEIMRADGTIDRVPATRLWFIPVMDVATRCIIGWSFSQQFNYNQYDVTDSIRNALMPKELMVLTIEGLKYPVNGGYPSTAFSELEYAMFDSIMLDNAKAHLAYNIRNKMADDLMCSVNFGSVATPETRGIVERFFGTLESTGFHRLPNTTGSNPRDPKRNNPEKAAVAYDITLEEIIQLLDVLIAEYNNTPHSSLSNLTPLECMERRIFESGMRPTVADVEMKKTIEMLNCITDYRKVCGGEGKRPHINYAGAEYRCNELSATGMYLGKRITLLIDPEDISEIDAYTEDGFYIGKLRAQGEFGTVSHSLKTRKEALKHSRELGRYRPDANTAMTAYERHLNGKAQTSRRDATKADIFRQEAGKPKPSEVSAKKKEKTSPIVNMIDYKKLAGVNNTDEFYQIVWGGSKEGKLK